MTCLLRLTDAAALAFHAMVLIAQRPKALVSTGEIASTLGASEAHLSKVLQRLTRAGLLQSTRGPKGGFALARPAGRISLLQVYEAIEGPFRPTSCLLGHPVCAGRSCIFGNLLTNINREVHEYLSNTKLSAFAKTEPMKGTK